MAILEMQVRDGVSFAKLEGQLDKGDAEQWLGALRQHAAASATPIIALLDFTGVEFVSAPARIVFAEATKTPNLRVIVIATHDLLMTQTARMISLLGERGRMRLFVSIEEARRYAADYAAGVG